MNPFDAIGLPLIATLCFVPALPVAEIDNDGHGAAKCRAALFLPAEPAF